MFKSLANIPERRARRVNRSPEIALSKVPEVTLGFWIIKIAATTLGETGGDSVTMTLGWGYLAGTALFLAALVVLVAAQIAAKRFQPILYWATRPLAGDRMHGRIGAAARIAGRDAGALALVAGHDLGRDGEHAEGR